MLRRLIIFSLLSVFEIVLTNTIKVYSTGEASMKIFYNFFLLIAIAIFLTINSFSQSKDYSEKERAEVMILGTFHFAYPNLDRIKIEEKDQLDFTSPERQKEIELLVEQIAQFKPTKIAVELKTWSQNKIDSLYNEYLKGNYELPINESYQVGFRLAKMLNHNRVYCVDAWGNINEYFDGDNKNVFTPKEEKLSMFEKLKAYSDSLLASDKVNVDERNSSAHNKTLQEILYESNQPEKINRDHASYFNNLFLFEENYGDYSGVDWLSASWFNRNMRIFRNIQRITESTDDRIFILYGSGHLYLLQNYLEASQKYNMIPVLDYLN